MLARLILISGLLGSCIKVPGSQSETKTFVAKQPIFWQCRTAPKVIRKWPDQNMFLMEQQITRFHRFGALDLLEKPRYIRQEIRQTLLSANNKPACELPQNRKITTFQSSVYDAVIKNGALPPSVNPEDIPNGFKCTAISAKLYIADLKEGSTILIPLAPYNEPNTKWETAGYQNSYAQFNITKVSNTLVPGIPNPELKYLEGTFEPIKISFNGETKELEPHQIPLFLSGAPLYKGWAALSDDPELIPTDTYGWIRSALFLSRLEQVNGKFLPVMRLVVSDWTD